MPNEPLYHAMTSRKIPQDGRVDEKKNETVPYKISDVRSNWTNAKWNTKLLEPDTRGCLLRN